MLGPAIQLSAEDSVVNELKDVVEISAHESRVELRSTFQPRGGNKCIHFYCPKARGGEESKRKQRKGADKGKKFDNDDDACAVNVKQSRRDVQSAEDVKASGAFAHKTEEQSECNCDMKFAFQHDAGLSRWYLNVGSGNPKAKSEERRLAAFRKKCRVT